jgi:prevent-host-death family protein
MVTINASEFKAKCLAILDEVAGTGETVVILKRGRPVAQLVAPVSTDSRYPQDDLKGSVRITGDVIGPVLPADAWEAVGEAPE